MGNYHYINLGKQNLIYVIDTDTFELKTVSSDSIKGLGVIGQFDCSTLQYKNENISVLKSSGTIIAEDSYTDTYIVAMPSKHTGKVNVSIVDKDRLPTYWVSGQKILCNRVTKDLSDITKTLGDLYKLESMNIVDLVRVITDKSSKATISALYESIKNKSSQNNSNKEQPNIKVDTQEKLKSNTKSTSNIDKKSNKTVSKNKISTDEKQSSAYMLKNQVKDSVENTVKNIYNNEDSLQSTINKLEKIIEQQKQTEALLVQENNKLKQRLSDITQRENSLIVKEQELKDKEEQIRVQEHTLKDAMCKLEEKPAYKIAEIVMDVKNVFTFKETPSIPKDKAVVLPKYTYEMILKSLSKGDIVSIPKMYIDTIEHRKLRFLQEIHNNNGYASLEQIQFYTGSKESLLAIMEFNNNTDEVKIYICREYGPESISQDDIILYTKAYLRLQKDMLILDKNKLTAIGE